jgi:purine-binding chemotaxis protein CheW
MKRAGTVDPEEELRLATFAVGDDLYAVDIMRIREIVRFTPPTPVRKAPPGMIGVIDLRGQVLPLFDLRLRFELPPRPDKDVHHVRNMIVSLDGRTLGVVVDRVHDMVTVTRGQLRIGEGVLAGEAADFFLGVCPIPQADGPDRLALLMNLRRVLGSAAHIPVADLLRGTNKTMPPMPAIHVAASKGER